VVVIEVQEKGQGVYEARVDGRFLCSSGQPFCDAARVLLSEGTDPRTRIVMRRKGSSWDCLGGVLGRVAKMSVCEPTKEKAHFIRWRPFPRLDL